MTMEQILILAYILAITALTLALAAHVRITRLEKRLELRSRLFRNDGK